MKKVLVALFALVLVIATAIPASADDNLVTNGGFESPVLGNGTWTIYFPGSNSTGWSTGDQGIEIQNHVAGTPNGGQQLCELDPNHPTFIYQDLATEAGQEYTLSFYYSGRQGIGPDDNYLKVTWGGTEVFTTTEDGRGKGDTDWKSYSTTVKGTGTSTRLEFSGVGPTDPVPSYGMYIDDVSVTSFNVNNPTPELPAGALLGLGLIGIGGLYFVNKRKEAVARA